MFSSRLARYVGTGITTLALAVSVPAGAAHAAGRAADRTKVGVSLYGSVLGWSQPHLDHEMEMVKRTGAEWVRVPLAWSTLQINGRGTYNWAPADRVIASARAHHLYVMPVVSYTPSWARPANTAATTPPTNPADYASFLARAARRYAPDGVHRWEIWNEPNMQQMWTPHPSPWQYAALLKAAYVALHRADPRAVVITGGLSPAFDAPGHSQVAPYTFLNGLYRAGAHGYFDQVGTHPSTYPYPSTYAASWSAFAQTPALHALMAAHHDGIKRVTATEIGFPTGTDPVAVTESRQGPYLVQGIQAWQRQTYAAPIFVYSIADEGPNIADHYENFGLVRVDGTLKPAYTALRDALVGS
jgi:polysaccharide biosynthesis protein PslG